jgi:hypothetical protein
MMTTLLIFIGSIAARYRAGAHVVQNSKLTRQIHILMAKKSLF